MTPRLFRPALAAAVFLLGSQSAALALNWRIAPDQSHIAFRYQEDGAPAEGRFEHFEGVAEFDDARPNRARMDLKIRVDSIALSDGFRSDFVKNETWFDARRFPVAGFTLNQIAPVAAEGAAAGETQRYTVEGVLTIKGRSKPIRTEIDLKLQDRTARATGSVDFSRAEFGVGDAFGGFFVDIGDKITVDFDITARRI